ncbi:MAG: hypothetical protein KAG53_08945 [Endozoicomonadaceae bacterium]|nr:hypothetical protein [Endozoicomonadaceae bacterium]
MNEVKADLDDSNSMSCPCFKDIIDVNNNSKNTKKTSIKRQLYGFLSGYFITMFAHLMEDPWTEADCNPTFLDICSVLANVYYPPASYLISAIQIATVFYAFANIPSCEARTIERVIEIDDFKMFQKIGEGNGYPTDGNYIITKDLIGNNDICPAIKNFRGSLDGKGHSISKYNGCLIRNLNGRGVIGNIIFKGSNITNVYCGPLIAMFASDNSLLKNIRVEDYCFNNNQGDSMVAILVGKLSNWARIEGCSVVGANIILQEDHPIFAFLTLEMFDDSSVDNNAIINARVNMDTKSRAYCGSVIYMYDRSYCDNITAINSTIKLSGNGIRSAFGAVLVRHTAQVNNLLAIGCKIEITGSGSAIAFGAAVLNVGDTRYTLSNHNMVIDSNLTIVDGGGAHVGIGAGEARSAQSDNNVVSGGHIEVKGVDSSAAVGIGYEYSGEQYSQSRNHIVINTEINASNNRSTVSISIGNRMEYNNIYNIIINSSITTLNKVYKIAFLGASNRATLCQGLSHYRAGLLNDNCTINQQIVDSYVNKITTWNMADMDSGRIIKIRIPDPVSVTMINEKVTITEKAAISGCAISLCITPSITPINAALITASGFIGLFIITCYCRGYRQGNRGRALIMYPLVMCQHWIRGTTTPERPGNTAVAYSAGTSDHELNPNPNYDDSFILPVYSEADPMYRASDESPPPSYSDS